MKFLNPIFPYVSPYCMLIVLLTKESPHTGLKPIWDQFATQKTINSPVIAHGKPCVLIILIISFAQKAGSPKKRKTYERPPLGQNLSKQEKNEKKMGFLHLEERTPFL